MKTQLALLASCLSVGQAFVTSPASRSSTSYKMSTADDGALMKTEKPTEKLSTMSEAIPFLARPKALKKELAGDFGFDPLSFAKDRDTLFYYREIEIKHARLAMLAAAGWPASELFDRPIAEFFGIPSTLDDMDRAPSFLNGNLDKVSPQFWGFCLGLTAAIDSYQTQRSRSQADYTPGDLGWDPLNFASSEPRKKDLQLAEMQNGRLAMLGVTGFAVQEFVTKQGVVDETPAFFQPLSETAEELLKGLLQ